MVTTPFLEIEKTSAERPFKIDFSRGHNNLKILLVEIGGRNKTTPSFIYVAYQPSSNEIEKLEWLENFKNLLADFYLKWKGVFIVTGDFNIDLPSDPKEPTRDIRTCYTPFLYTNTSQKLQQKTRR